MQKIIQALLVSTLMAGPFCQKIEFDNSTLISPCTTGARSAVDTYLITGNIGDNITLALTQKWQTGVYIQVLRRTAPQFETICQLLMGIGTCQPFPLSASKCECFYNRTTDQANFTVSGPVQAEDSKAIINVEWRNQNKTSIYSNKNYTFPEIYDMNAAQLSLTVAGVIGNLPSRSCNFSLTLNKSNDLELCCSNTAKPCNPQISFSGAVVTNNTNNTCVTYPTSQLASDGVTGMLDLSYSMCTHTDYTQGSNCTVTPKPKSKAESDDNKCNVTCIVVIVVVVVVIIIGGGIAIAVYFFKIKKRSKAICNHGTNENEGKAHTSEQPKKERQYPEYTNQVYDGRRSSPSEVTIDGVKTTTHDNVQQHNTGQEKDSNKPISGRTDDGSTSHTVPGNPRQLPPLKGTRTHGQLHPATAVSRPASIEITSTKAVKP